MWKVTRFDLSCQYTAKTKFRFGERYSWFGCETKTGWYVFWLFSKVTLYLAISFERFRRELSIDVAEHRSVYPEK